MTALAELAGSTRTAGFAAQLFEQGFGFLERGCVETLGEPAIDFGEQGLRLSGAPLRFEPPRKVRGSLQLVVLRALAASALDRRAICAFGR